MNTSLIAVLICFGLCIKIALTIGAISYFKRPSSKGTRKQKRKGGQRETAARKKKAASPAPAAIENSPKPVTKEPPVPSPNKPLKPAPAVNQKQAEPKITGATAAATEAKRKEEPRQAPPTVKTPATREAATVEKPPQEPLEMKMPAGERKSMKVVTGPPQEKGEKIGVVDIRKQPQTRYVVPARAPSQAGSSRDSTATGEAATVAPREQSTSTGPKSAEKPPLEPVTTNTNEGEIDKSPENVEPEVTAVKEGEPGTGDNQESPEPTEEEEKEEDKSQKEKSGLGDLADLFATSASDFTEKSKLSEQVTEVDVGDILKEGLDLLGKVKKPEK